MNEREFLQEISRHWPDAMSSTGSSSTTVALADEAVESFPASAPLWTMRGDLLQLADADSGYELGEVERCYRKAIESDPLYAPAYEELGRFLALVMDNRRKAKRFLEKARRLRRSATTASSSNG